MWPDAPPSVLQPNVARRSAVGSAFPIEVKKMTDRCPLTCVVTIACIFIASHCHAQQPPQDDSANEANPQTIDEALLFSPTKFPTGDWEPKGLRFEDIFFSSKDGTKLHGWYCPSDHPRGVVLIAHGNAGHVASRAPWLRYLQSQAQLSVFMFDYRGYGRSEGIPTVEGAIADATAAREKLRELASVDDAQMLLMGESLGGAIVTQLAADSAPCGLILQSTFSSLRDVADVHFPKLSWMVPRNKLDSAAVIAEYHGPLLQSHGNRDRTIPFSLGEKLFRSANEPKQLFTVEGADHNNWLTHAYLEQLDAFIAGVTPPSK
ncbi:MAG: alpha/beta hydrolase [Planctomycetales bacterium]|nr:alpha/beta hydrolase [Planctomycetales bacterium]